MSPIPSRRSPGPSRRRAALLLMAVPAAVLAGCGDSQGEPPLAWPTRRSGSASPSPARRIVPRETPTCSAEGGDRVEVALKANNTTPYQWIYEMSAPGVLKEACKEYLVDEHEAGLSGVGGTTRFVFAAVGDGTVALTFTYAYTYDLYATTAPATAPASSGGDLDSSRDPRREERSYSVVNGFITRIR